MLGGGYCPCDTKGLAHPATNNTAYGRSRHGGRRSETDLGDLDPVTTAHMACNVSKGALEGSRLTSHGGWLRFGPASQARCGLDGRGSVLTCQRPE